MRIRRGKVSRYEIKAGTRYRYRITVGKLPNGRPDQRKASEFHTKQEAEAALTIVEQDLMRGTFFYESDVPFGEYALDWIINEKKHDIASSTYIKYKNIVDRHLADNNHFKNKEMSKIRRADIREYFIDKAKTGLSKSYVQDMVKILRQILRHAVLNEDIKADPSEFVDLPRIEEDSQEVADQVWNESEVNHFLDASKNERMYHAFLILLHTGMRRGETLALRWGDLNVNKKELTIQAALRLKEDSTYYLSETKTTSSNRIIKISNFIIDSLLELKRENEEYKEMIGEKLEPTDFIITNNEHKMQDPRNLTRVKDRIIEKEGMRRIRIHDFRHTHASLLLAAGIEPMRVQQRLGHSSLSVTLDIYAHFIPRENDDIADQFDNLLNQ